MPFSTANNSDINTLFRLDLEVEFTLVFPAVLFVVEESPLVSELVDGVADGSTSICAIAVFHRANWFFLAIVNWLRIFSGKLLRSL